MSTQRKSAGVPLNRKPAGRIKAAALPLFKVVRWLARNGVEAPQQIIAVKREVIEAWKESARC